MKTEGVSSKHVIVCDNCQKVFYFENAFEDHKPCKTSKVIRINSANFHH
jgi:hypothetical protein